MDENANGSLPPELKAWTLPNVILIGTGILLLIAAILLYPEARQRIDQQQALSTQTAAPTLTLPSPSPTETPQATPQAVHRDPEIYTYPSQFGTLILAIQEGTDIHLFAYQPFLEDWGGTGFSGLPLTRMTSGPHQDITPDISPDGRYIAFSSNRNGPWDIYILDLLTGDVEQFTDSAAYDANPSWSPDGQWLAYESYQINNLEILLQSRDRASGPIPLTRNPAADFAPDWSGQGRWISFISSRSGRLEVWYADLDSPEEDKAVRIPNPPGEIVKHPAWSADGRYLTWSVVTQEGNHSLVTWDSQHPNQDPVYSGTGDWPLWAGDGELLYSIVEQPYESYLTAYPGPNDDPQVMLPAVKLPGKVEGFSWFGGEDFSWLADLSSGPAPTPLWDSAARAEGNAGQGTADLINLRNVSAPSPKFHEDAVSSFSDLRAEVIRETGWDFLSTLENAYVPPDQPLAPGVNLDWLYTGRGMAVNDLPRLANWLVLARDDHGSQTYWRVYIRTINQQGFQGSPLQFYSWDLQARYSGKNADYENGGALSKAIPQGYWVDFTALAEAYGWKRFPAETFWQFSEKASRYQYFAFTQGLSLEEALGQVYSAEELPSYESFANP